MSDYKTEMEKASKEGSVWVVLFTEDWCGPCRILKAQLKSLQLSKTFDNLVVSKLGLQSAQAVKYKEYFQKLREPQVTSIPTWLVFVYKDGAFHRTGRYTGSNGIVEITKKLRKQPIITPKKQG